MTTMSADDVKRIALPIDYSLLDGKQTEGIEILLRGGGLQLNAACNNRSALIEALTSELSSMPPDSPERSKVANCIEDYRKAIIQDKIDGIHFDYRALKERIANGAKWEDIYPEAPFFYARAWDCYKEFVGSNSRRDKGGIIDGISKLAPAVATILRSANKWS